MDYSLPKSVEINGIEYAIRYDFRCILDICAMLEDPNIETRDKALIAGIIFYPDFDAIPAKDMKEAIEKCYWFIDFGGEAPRKKGPRLVSWGKDVKYIIAPVNRVLGQEIREIPYGKENNTGGLHWWTFLSAFWEIGDCTWAQVVNIRNKTAKGKKLEKYEREWARENAELIQLPNLESKSDKDFFAMVSGVSVDNKF